MRYLFREKFITRCRYTIGMALACLCISQPYATTKEVNMKRDRYLLLDNRIVEKSENAQLTLGTVKKHTANPLFGEDKPWEKRFDNLYGNVIFDEKDGLYRCWYSPFIIDHSAKDMPLAERDKKPYDPPPNREMGICYAVSRDGISWEKPNLGLVDFNGSTSNNIVWREPHGAGIFKDAHDPDPKRRYKAIFAGLKVSVSSDGLHWETPLLCKGVDVAGDTHNNAFWAPTLEKYVGITRSWGPMGREVARIESKDFVHWSKEKVVLEGLNKNLQPYAMPVFFHGGVYLGLVAIHDQKTDRVWTELTWSADTKKWHRVCPGTPLIPCSEKKLDYDYGCVYPCAYPVFLKDSIRLYYGGSDYLHFGWRNGFLCLATLRPDGFAGYKQISEDKPAIIVTTPIPYSGNTIKITADVKKLGEIKISIIDKNGTILSKTTPITKTVTDEPLKLEKKITAKTIQLQCELNNATLYSFSIDN